MINKDLLEEQRIMRRKLAAVLSALMLLGAMAGCGTKTGGYASDGNAYASYGNAYASYGNVYASDGNAYASDGNARG